LFNTSQREATKLRFFKQFFKLFVVYQNLRLKLLKHDFEGKFNRPNHLQKGKYLIMCFI